MWLKILVLESNSLKIYLKVLLKIKGINDLREEFFEAFK